MIGRVDLLFSIWWELVDDLNKTDVVREEESESEDAGC